MRFCAWQPETLAAAGVELWLVGLAVFVFLVLLIGLGRWVVDFFGLDREDDES